MGLPGRTLDLNEIMDEGKILLVNLEGSDQLHEEQARVFGALLVNQFFEAARRRRQDARGHDPKPYYLYIDEFQNFVGLDIAAMLDQVRKRGLYLTLAHQRFGQLNDENIIDAALSNYGIKAVFGGLIVPNARRMAEELLMQRGCATTHENHQWILRRSDNRVPAAPKAGVQSRDRRERGHLA